MLDSLEELEKKQDEVAAIQDQFRNKEKKEELNQVLLDVAEDHFGTDMFSANYKQVIMKRKIWTDDELVSQIKCYERLFNRLTKLQIKSSMILEEKNKGMVKRKRKGKQLMQVEQ